MPPSMEISNTALCVYEDIGTSDKRATFTFTDTSSVALTGGNGGSVMRITNISTPTADSDAATKGYVDSAARGLRVREPVRVMASTNGTLASAYANGQTVDGVTLVTGDRILLQAQTTASENGIWVITAGAPTRPLDFATGTDASGVYIFVDQGTQWMDRSFVCTSDKGSDIVDTDSLVFAQFGSRPSALAGVGLKVGTGNELDVDETFIPHLSANNTFTGSNSLGGTTTFTGPVSANTTITATGAVTANSTLGVTGATTLGSTLGVTGATTLSDTLGVTGAVTASSTLGVTGATTLSDTLNVTGASTLGSTLGVTGPATLGNTLGVTGATTLSDTLDVTGASTLTGAVTTSSTLGVTGATTLSDTLAVTGAATMGSTLGVTGATTLSNTLGVTGAATLGSTLGVTGATTLSDTLAVTGAATMSSTLGVTGTITAPKVDGITTIDSDDCAISRGYLNTQLYDRCAKQPVRAASIANQTIATLANASAVDGVTLSTGDRVLLKDQTTATENGIYVIGASGPATRSNDMASGLDVSGCTVVVREGTTNADQFLTCSSNSPTATVGTHTLTFTNLGAKAGAALEKTSADVLNVLTDNSTIEISGNQLRVVPGSVGGGQLADGSIANVKLVNDSVTVNTNRGLSGGQEVDLGATMAISVDHTVVPDLAAANTFADTNVFTAGVASTSQTTGTIQVTGGVGISGNLYVNSTYNMSDERLKKGITEIDPCDALGKIDQLRGCFYQWNENVPDLEDKPAIGLIAQEVQKVAPLCVNEGEDGYLAIDYPKLVPYLVQCIKELKRKVGTLEGDSEQPKKRTKKST